MARKHNLAQAVNALALMFGVKGQMTSELEETINPVVNIANMWDSPYLRYGIPVGESMAVAAVAAENGYIVAVPGNDVALQIKQITFANDTANNQLLVLAMMTAANISAAGLTTSPQQMIDLAAVPTAAQMKSSKVIAGTHTSILGGQFYGIRLLPNDSKILTLPDPGVILYGNDEGGPPGLAVVNFTQNDVVRASFLGREWPLPK